MELKLNTSQVITVQDEFALLEDVGETTYKYGFRTLANKTLAGSTGATELVVRLYKTDPKGDVSLSVFDGLKPPTQTLSVLNVDTRGLVRALQSRASKTMAAISSGRREELVVNRYSLIGLIEQASVGVGYTTVQSNPGITGTVVYDSTNTTTSGYLNEDKTTTLLSDELVRVYCVDPASVLSKPRYSTATPEQVHNGARPTEENTTGLPNPAVLLLEQLSNTNSTVVQNADVASSVVAYSLANAEVVPVVVKLAVPKAAVGEADFFVMITLYDGDGGVVQELVRQVPHTRNLQEFKVVQQPPTLNVVAIGNRDKHLVQLQQQDKNATGVRLYKTVFNDTVKGTPKQVLVGDYLLSPGETKTLTLSTSDVGRIIYRALAYNGNQSIGSRFSSVVICQFPTSTIATTPERNPFVSIDTRYVQEGLSITVGDVPNDTSFITLYKQRKDMDAELLTTFFVGGMGNTARYNYIDADVQEFRQYSYWCELTDNKGGQAVGSGLVELVYRPKRVDYAVVSVTEPVVTNTQSPNSSRQLYDVTFQVDYSITETLEDSVRTLLASQGLSEFYGRDINRERLRELLVTKVELKDNGSNDKYFMTFTGGEYTQSNTKYGMIDKPGSYTFELTTYARNPGTLLENAVVTGSSTARPNGLVTPPSYSYSPYVMDNPYGLQNGVLPKSDGDEFVTQLGLSQLELGVVTSVDYINVELTPPEPVVTNQRAVVINTKTVKVMWSVNGNQDSISHFVVRRRNHTTNTVDLLGAAHGVNQQNSFMFYDQLRPTETGVFSYIITLVGFDWLEKSEVETVEVTV